MVKNRRCKKCHAALTFHKGLEGSRAKETGLMVIVHKPDRRIEVPTLFGEDQQYISALMNSRTGRSFGELLRYCGLDWQDVLWTNLYKCSLLGDREPRMEEYRKCLPILERQIRSFRPKAIMVCGRMPYRLVLGRSAYEFDFRNSVRLSEVVMHKGRTPSLVLPHPSGLCVPYCSRSEEKRRFEAARVFVQTHVTSQ
jgi:uracil-DNA glycosylase family 4